MSGWLPPEQKRDREMMRVIAAGIVLAVVILVGWRILHDHREMESRSTRWPTVRAAHLQAHPACEVCGETQCVEVHHYIPFKDRPDLELDQDNLVTLCGHGSRWNHHLWFGHRGSYKRGNPYLKQWIKAVKERDDD